jgi:hypothetical protein
MNVDRTIVTAQAIFAAFGDDREALFAQTDEVCRRVIRDPIEEARLLTVLHRGLTALEQVQQAQWILATARDPSRVRSTEFSGRKGNGGGQTQVPEAGWNGVSF